MAQKLFVGGLPYATTQDELTDAFRQAGNVVSVYISTDRDTGRSNGFGFVEMGSDDEAQSAITMWNGKEFGGRTLKVDVARPKEDRPRRERFAGGSDRAPRRDWDRNA